MAVPVTLPDNYGLVLGATVSAVFINVLHVLKVMECRHKFGIKPPAVVAGPEHIKKHPDAALFDCAFRAHANYLENLPPFLVSIAILGLRYPVASAVATAIWIAGRVAYLFGYVNKGKQGAKARVPGFGIAIYTQLVVMAGAAYSAYTFIF